MYQKELTNVIIGTDLFVVLITCLTWYKKIETDCCGSFLEDTLFVGITQAQHPYVVQLTNGRKKRF